MVTDVLQGSEAGIGRGHCSVLRSTLDDQYSPSRSHPCIIAADYTDYILQADFFSATTGCSIMSPLAGHTCMASCSVDHAEPDLWARRVYVPVGDADADVGAQARRRGRELSCCKAD